jgi:hypothetical protein
MQYKTTKKLFRGIYQYKIVLVCAGASVFRSGNMDSALDDLKKITITNNGANKLDAPYYSSWRAGIKTHEELDYAFKLQDVLSTLTDIDVRVESPWVSVYTNNKKDVDIIAKIDSSNVKYICVPPANANLTTGTIIMPKMDYEYRITLGKTTQEHSSFIQWAEASTKLKLTKSCIRDLSKHRSWGGTHFYLSGDNNLLMARMHLGGSIAKIERIIKQ